MTQESARIGRPRRFAIDVAAVANLLGTLAKYLGLVVVFPIGVALWYGEPVWPFVVTGAGTSAFGYILERLTPDAKLRLGVREGFLVVSAMLLTTAAFASLPYLFVGGEQLDHPLDAYLEGMSAATTTGASVVTDFDELSKSLSMWRQFTQWLGGMGIIILAVAILPRLRVGGRQMMESELPGPEVAALSERIRETARLLWGLYIALTVVLTLALASLGWLGVDDAMTFYEALAHAFATMPTGGFSTQPNSIAAFSPAAQWIIAFFMLLAGVNFLLLFRAIVRRHPRVFVRDEEFRLYLGLVAIASIALLVELSSYGLFEGEEAVRTAVFQAISIITTTGFGDNRLRALAGLVSDDAVRAHVSRRLGRLDDGLDQGRAPPARRQDPAARARPDGKPGGRHADPAQRRAGRRADVACDRRVHPAVRGAVGSRRLGHRDRLGDLRRAARRARLVQRLRECARKRRSRVRDHRAVRRRSRPSATSRRSR